jgi:hypothetical protein
VQLGLLSHWTRPNCPPPVSRIQRVGHDTLRICVGHMFVTCPVHRIRAKHVSDMYPQRVLKTGHVPYIEKDPSSCFLMQVAAVRCFDVQLRVIFPY